MSEKIQKILAVVLAVATIATITYFYATGLKELKEAEHQYNLTDKQFVIDHVHIQNSKYGENVYEVKTSEDITPFNMLYQEAVTEKINLLLKNEYTIDHPFMIYNPYGTNKNSMNIYFKTKEKAEVSYTIKTEGLEDFSRTLNNGKENNLTEDHAYQIIGFVVGKKNILQLVLKDENGNILEEKELTIDLSKIKSTVATKIKSKEGVSKEELSDGLFVMFGHDKAYNANNYIYDNFGILRSELVLEGYRSDRIIFTDDAMIYSYKNDGLLKVDRMGRIIEEYSIAGYEMHHDYILDEANENLLILANKKGADTIEDRIISLNLNTGKVKEVIDMKDYMIEFYDKAIKPEVNTYGGDELDWIHLNSLDIIDGRDVILSSRELSAIIYVENIYANPTIKYVITDPSVLKDTSYKELNYQKQGDFVSQAGQHTITYEPIENSDQYYLYMYNNNYQGARTRPKFNWENYPGTGTYEKGNESHYYKYLVDEEKKTYQLVDKVVLPYSSIVSSIEDFDNHYITSSGMSHCFNEYDGDGNLIKEYNYTSKKYAYRIFKYTFNNIWFS